MKIKTLKKGTAKMSKKTPGARPAHRPPKGQHGPRQTLRARVDPEAIRRIDQARKNKGQSLGDYLSEHGMGLLP